MRRATKWLLGTLAVGGAGAGLAMLLRDDDAPAGPPPPNPDPDQGDEPDQVGGPLPPPDNLVRLQRPQDFEGIDRIIEGQGKAIGPHRRAVVLGYSPTWAGLGDTMADLEQLAREHYDVKFITFRFRDSFEAIGKPQSYVAYVATAVDTAGNIYPHPRSTTDKVAPPIGGFTLRALLDFALHGSLEQQPGPVQPPPAGPQVQPKQAHVGGAGQSEGEGGSTMKTFTLGG